MQHPCYSLCFFAFQELGSLEELGILNGSFVQLTRVAGAMLKIVDVSLSSYNVFISIEYI